MLIKGVDKRGNAILVSPENALSHAVVRATARLNNPETIFLPKQDTVAVDGSVEVSPGKDGGWVATARGNLMVGLCKTADGKVYVDKPYSFYVRYSDTKDEFGIPDIELVESKVEAIAKVDIGSVPDSAA